MNAQFGEEQVFVEGLHKLLRDPVARRLRTSHMGPARNTAVFHYDPEEFGRVIETASVRECEFMEGQGNSSTRCYFPFMDAVATELWAGKADSSEEFYANLGSLMQDTRDLAKRFIESAHRLILHSLRDWKFRRRPLP